MFTED